MNNPQENSISSYISAREREFEERFPEVTSILRNGDTSWQLAHNTSEIRQYLTASMTGLADVLRDVINEIEICTCKPGDACNVCGGNKDKGVKEKMLEALEKKGLEDNQ